jgi:hypothetical protein
MKVILVFSHEHNTFDKSKLLINANPDIVRDSPKKVMDLIVHVMEKMGKIMEVEEVELLKVELVLEHALEEQELKV